MACNPVRDALFSAAETLRKQWVRISRVVIAVLIPAAFLFLGHGYSAHGSFWHSPEYASFMQWVAITAVVVTLPTVGKTTQKAFERALGSICGGALGLAFVWSDAAWAKLLGMVVAATLGEFVCVHFKKEYTGKLMAMTYLIVVAAGLEAPTHPWLASVERMMSVLAGIALTFVISLVWFPETSSKVAFQQLLVMMQLVRSLGTDTWALMEQQQQQQQQEQLEEQQSLLPGKCSSKGAEVPASKAVVVGLSDLHQAASQQELQDCRALPASGDVCIEMNDCRKKAGEVQQQQQEQHEQHPWQLLQPQDDPCDMDVRQFFAARVALQDALAASEAEHHLGWLCGAPVIAPKVLSPCQSPLGCCAARAKSSKQPSKGSPIDATGTGRAAGAAVAGAGHVCGLPPYLSREHVRQVAIALRHCTHVLWMLHKLLMDGFNQEALQALHRNSLYPADMLSNIQQESTAVLQLATNCLETAVQHHRHWHLAKGSRSSTAAKEVLQPQLQQLQQSMHRLHQHLQVWRQTYIQLSHLRREAALEMQRHKCQLAVSHSVQELTQSDSNGYVAADFAAPAAAAATFGGSRSSYTTTQQQQQPSLADTGHTACDAQRTDLATAEAAAVDQTGLQKSLQLFFVTPNSPESYLFVLQWHALHYTLQQLDQAFMQLTGSLEQLLYVMHGIKHS